MTDPDALGNLVAAVEPDVSALLNRVVTELGLDDGPALAGLGSMFSEAWIAGARAAIQSDAVRGAIDAGVSINEDAARAMADAARPTTTADDVIAGLGAETAKRRNPNRGATRHEIAAHLGVSAGEISREGRDPDGPLGRAVLRGYVTAHPRDQGFWLLTPSGEARLSLMN